MNKIVDTIKVLIGWVAIEIASVALVIVIIIGFMSKIKIVNIATLSAVFIPLIAVTGYGSFYIVRCYKIKTWKYIYIVPAHLLTAASFLLMAWLYIEFLIRFISN